MAISKVQYKSSPSATAEIWMDATSATAGAGDITAPKTAMLANGVMTTGTGGGGGIQEPDEKDVNFYDYDGTRLYSYTAVEAQALTALPANPTHTGLTAQGWNWTLAQIKSQLTAIDGIVNVGQMYVTSNGKTELDVVMNDPDFLNPRLYLAVNGSVTIDWGDGNTDTMTGTSDTNQVYTAHVYGSVGSYTISITVNNGKFTFRNNGYPSPLNVNHDSGRNGPIYSDMITDIRLGTNALLGPYAFNYCYSLKSITVPNTVTVFDVYVFSRCYALRYVTVPSEITAIGNHAFDSAFTLQIVSIPYGVTSFGEYAFSQSYRLRSLTVPSGLNEMKKNALANCQGIKSFVMPSGITSVADSVLYYAMSLTKLVISTEVTTIGTQAFFALRSLQTITIPAKVTSIAASAFSGSYMIGEMHFLSATPPTLASDNVFSNLISGCKIYVPTGSLSAYTSAANYPSSSTYTYIEE